MAGKVEIECPQCNSRQMESPYAQNTICRHCTAHIDLSKPEKSEKADKGPSWLSRLTQGIHKEHDVQVKCFKCGAKQTVTSSAKSTFCPKCTRYIDLRDHKIAGAFSRNIETQGMIHITPKGDLGSSKASCRDALVQGRLRGNLVCSGEALFKMKGRVNGAIDADSLIVEKKSDLEFVRPITVRAAEIRGKTSARITASGVVTITKSGWLEGIVHAKGITVEKGGVFSGELYIGEGKLEQADLLGNENDQPELFGGDVGLATP